MADFPNKVMIKFVTDTLNDDISIKHLSQKCYNLINSIPDSSTKDTKPKNIPPSKFELQKYSCDLE